MFNVVLTLFGMREIMTKNYSEAAATTVIIMISGRMMEESRTPAEQ